MVSTVLTGVGFLGRNEEYNKLTIEFSLGFAKAGFAGMLLPDALRRYDFK